LKNVEKTGGEFRKFHKFSCGMRTYLLPIDMANKEKSMLDEDLLLSIIHGDQMNVYNFDFSKADEEIDVNIEENREVMEDVSHYLHSDFFSEENHKKRTYMKYLPNRDYNDDYGREKLKNPMGDDGTYIDNGYR